MRRYLTGGGLAITAAAACGLILAGCATTPHPTYPTARNRAPQGTAPQGTYKVGAPYEVAGVWYTPAEQPGYDEVGIASWYGDEFHDRSTANGERFDKYVASAAHTTLPLPSIVEVTNLENGRSIRVRLNDRGPFKAGRIIDLSRAAADELGFVQKGTAQVRVRYVGPAKLGGGNEPLYVARGPMVAPPPVAAPAPPAAQATWGSRPVVQTTIAAAPLAPLTPSPFTPSPYAPPSPLLPAAAPLYVPAPQPIRVASVSGFAVQAGAYATRTRAEEIAHSLASAGTTAVRPVDLAAGRLWRVVVGPWSDEATAWAARAEVAALGFADARVVKAF